MSLLVIGSMAFDTVKTPYGEASEVLGGSATYCAVAASYFTDVRVIAVVGRDFGEEPMRLLRERGIDVSGIETAPGKTFRWSGVYSDDLNERTTLSTHLNVFESFKPKIREADAAAPHVFLGNIDPELQAQVLRRLNPRLSACDTMNFWIEGKNEALKRLLSEVHGLLINDSEARLLAGELNTVVAARRLLSLGLRFLVIKRGEYGAALFAGGHYFAVPAYPIERPVDPTGAGDSFAGGFMGHLARTGDLSARSLRDAMVYGSVLASFCVEDFSLRRLGALNAREIEARAAELRDFLSLDGPAAPR
ncbi:MAG TPA: PfkB family carbohydrate kinase [Candidatus Polarisedimenticolia bacterium]|jgi:sugar/nucleoside kinase (ribokinase family)|nr:PfkB family carbohydrate kinase [Candidatus Polarisedimenticolia bacterium]